MFRPSMDLALAIKSYLNKFPSPNLELFTLWIKKEIPNENITSKEII